MFGIHDAEAQEQASSDEKGPGLPALRRPDHEESEMRAAARVYLLTHLCASQEDECGTAACGVSPRTAGRGWWGYSVRVRVSGLEPEAV